MIDFSKEPKQKRKRGRPKKKPPEVPHFENKSQIRDYLIEKGLKLSFEMVEIASKKNNIKKHQIADAKTKQYKAALNSLKTINDIIKDAQIDELEDKFNNFELGLMSINNKQDNETALIEFEKLQDEYTKIKEN